MRAFAIPLLVAGLAGCSHTQVSLNAGAVSSASGGTTISSSRSGVSIQSSGSTAAALIGLGVAAAIVSRGEERGYGTRYSMNPFAAIGGTPSAPQLAPQRSVNEQDCTQPIADASANLKCR